MVDKVELAAFVLSAAGWLCAVLTRCLPVWRVRDTLDNTTTPLPVYWGGVWLEWGHHWEQKIDGSLHCNFYQSLLTLSENFRSWRTLITASIGLGAFPVVIYLVGVLRFPGRFQVTVVSGVVFVLAGVLLLVPVSWTCYHTTVSLGDSESLSRDWGAALFAGWISIVLFVLGGSVLSTRCRTAQLQVIETGRPREPEPGVQDPFFHIHNTAYRQGPFMYPQGPVAPSPN